MKDWFTGNWIYFVRWGNKTKIGKSTNPRKRFNNFQTGFPEKLIMFAIVPESKDMLEDDYHFEYKKFKIRGEWFELTLKNLLPVLLNCWTKEQIVEHLEDWGFPIRIKKQNPTTRMFD